MREIRKGLDASSCDYERRERFLVFCVQGDEHTESLVRWELVVWELLRQLISERKSGTSRAFKNIASKIANELKL
ncbi:MAP/microtubule affinity-regulating kinase 3 [Sciurus carolinensis]|nr:MAP/microtubule affinity-regulating kinase 3 [Sciurus carolinensis]